MANNQADTAQQIFSNNLVLLAQQKDSRLRGTVATGTHTGSEQASAVDQIAATTVAQEQTRFQPKILTDIVHSRRWVLPTSFSTHSPVTNFDKIRTMIQMDSQYLRDQVAAMNRQIDISLVDAINGTSNIGKDGTSTESWPTGNDIAVGTTDLTTAKLLAARQQLLEADVDIDDPNDAIQCWITPHQENTLINEQEFNNADFGNTVFDKSNGLHGKEWFGIRFTVTNLLVDTSGVRAAAGTSAIRAIPFFAKSAMHLGLWDDVRGVIQQRVDLEGDPNEMSVYATFGSTRLESAKHARIICKET